MLGGMCCEIEMVDRRSVVKMRGGLEILSGRAADDPKMYGMGNVILSEHLSTVDGCCDVLCLRHCVAEEESESMMHFDGCCGMSCVGDRL